MKTKVQRPAGPLGPSARRTMRSGCPTWATKPHLCRESLWFSEGRPQPGLRPVGPCPSSRSASSGSVSFSSTSGVGKTLVNGRRKLRCRGRNQTARRSSRELRSSSRLWPPCSFEPGTPRRRTASGCGCRCSGRIPRSSRGGRSSCRTSGLARSCRLSFWPAATSFGRPFGPGHRARRRACTQTQTLGLCWRTSALAGRLWPCCRRRRPRCWARRLLQKTAHSMRRQGLTFSHPTFLSTSQGRASSAATQGWCTQRSSKGTSCMCLVAGSTKFSTWRSPLSP
mmetsp:Transcript_90955/g.294376  ORF Transcript_90955/g.294376 Transcript_90955/m.294376 type:complete len:282 (+) Transcript_90955:83-928(+)